MFLVFVTQAGVSACLPGQTQDICQNYMPQHLYTNNPILFQNIPNNIPCQDRPQMNNTRALNEGAITIYPFSGGQNHVQGRGTTTRPGLHTAGPSTCNISSGLTLRNKVPHLPLMSLSHSTHTLILVPNVAGRHPVMHIYQRRAEQTTLIQ